MATSSSKMKLSQQELRQLMREKTIQSKKCTRIDSPLARYDERGQLWCRICNQIINNELLWSTHLIGKSHKKVCKIMLSWNLFYLMIFFLLTPLESGRIETKIKIFDDKRIITIIEWSTKKISKC